MSLSAEILFNIVAVETDSGDIAATNRITRADYFKALSDGTGADQAQIVWSDTRTIFGTDTLQLSSLADARDGAAVTVSFSAVKAVFVENKSTLYSLTLTGAFSGSVPPGGMLAVVNPTADGSTASTLFVASASGSATYDLVIVGEGTIV